MNRRDPVETREVQFEQACKRAEVFDYNHLDYIEKGLAPPCPPYTSKNQYSFVGHFVVVAWRLKYRTITYYVLVVVTIKHISYEI